MRLSNGGLKRFPLASFPRLKGAPYDELQAYTLSKFGIHWPSLDEDISFAALIRGIDFDIHSNHKLLSHFPSHSLVSYVHHVLQPETPDVFGYCQRTLASFSDKFPRKDLLEKWQRTPLMRLLGVFEGLHSISESILILLQNNKLYDATILVRSLIEGQVILTNVFEGQDGFEVNSSEFCVDLFEALVAHESTKAHEHHKAAERNPLLRFMRFGTDIPEPPDYYAEYQKEHPRKSRREIRQKWSAGEILTRLESTSFSAEKRASTRLLWSAASHLAHNDPCSSEIRFWTGAREVDRAGINFDASVSHCGTVLALAHMRLNMAVTFVQTSLKDWDGSLSEEVQNLFEISGALRMRRSALEGLLPEHMTRQEVEEYLWELGKEWVAS